MERLTQEQIESIRKRAEAATEGPWYYDRQTGDLIEINDREYPSRVLAQEVNGVFIAHAREDVPALLAEIERLKAEIERLEIENKTLEKVATNQTVKIKRQSDFDWYVGY